MSKKNFVFTITMVVLLISALSVFSIVKEFTNPDADPVRSESSSLYKPSKKKSFSGCSAQSGIRPPAWNVEDKNKKKLDNLGV